MRLVCTLQMHAEKDGRMTLSQSGLPMGIHISTSFGKYHTWANTIRG